MASEKEETGYKSPLKDTQFSKGRSGNPKGRPKGAKNLKTILLKELESQISIQEKGKDSRGHKARGLHKKPHCRRFERRPQVFPDIGQAHGQPFDRQGRRHLGRFSARRRYENIGEIPEKRNPQKKALHALLRTNLSAFIMKTFHTMDGSQEYVPNWHIELIADKLTRCMKGEIKRLIINLPPRSLKSICSSVAFPAWVLGQDPGKQIISAAYSDDLSGKHARDCRSLMESNWYRELFPRTRINPRKRTKTEFETT